MDEINRSSEFYSDALESFSYINKSVPRLRFSHFVIDTIVGNRTSRRRIQGCYAHADLKLLARFLPELYSTQSYYHYSYSYYYYYYFFFFGGGGRIPIERFRSRGQHICKFMITKEIVKKEFNSPRICLKRQHGHRDVM